MHECGQVDEKIHRTTRRMRYFLEQGVKQGAQRIKPAIGQKLFGKPRFQREGPKGGFGFDEKIKRIDGGNFSREVNRDAECRDRFCQQYARHEIPKRVLLPMQPMRRRFDTERIGQDRRAALRRRAQANELRAKPHRTRIAIGAAMGQGESNRHAGAFAIPEFIHAEPPPCRAD